MTLAFFPLFDASDLPLLSGSVSESVAVLRLPFVFGFLGVLFALPVGVEVEVEVLFSPPVLIPWAFISLEYRLTLCFVSFSYP